MNYFNAYQEIEEHLDTLQDIVQNLTYNSNSPNLINEIFRLVHCIKGTAQMIEDHALALKFHHFEDYLIQIKEGHSFFDQKFLKDFYAIIDLSYKQIEEKKYLRVLVA